MVYNTKSLRPTWTQVSYDTEHEVKPQPKEEKATTATKKPRKGTKKEDKDAVDA